MRYLRLHIFACLAIVGLASGSENYVPDEVLVRYKLGATEAEIAALEAAEKLTFLAAIPLVNTRVYKTAGGKSPLEIAHALQRYLIVSFAEPNYKREISSINDPSFNRQWALHNTGQIVNGYLGPPGIDIKWPAAIALLDQSNPVIVAVIDSGVAIDHKEIFQNTHIVWNEVEANGRDDDSNGWIDDPVGYDFFAQNNTPLDQNGHGTLVASIIAGIKDNSLGGTGVNPFAKILPLRILDQFGRGSIPKFARASDVALALSYAALNGARVVNMSFGGGNSSATELSVLRALNSMGVFCIAAAGNGGLDAQGDNNDITPTFPASYSSPNLIAVAAQDRSGGLASFSNFGHTTVHLAAPGTQILGAALTRSTIYTESFSTTAPGWTASAEPLNQSPWGWGLASGSLANNIVAQRYTPWTNTWASSPKLDLSSSYGSRLTFTANYDLADDILWIEASSNGLLWYPYGYLIGSTNNSWQDASVDISDFDGSSAYFRFRLFSNGSLAGNGVAVTDFEVSSVTFLDPGAPRFTFSDGTSFAAPIVAGVASLMLTQRPKLSVDQMRSILLRSTSPIPALNGKVATGGMVDARRAVELTKLAPDPVCSPSHLSAHPNTSQFATAVVTGQAPFSYQWIKDGSLLAGQTTANLSLGGFGPAHAGLYSVSATNAITTTESAPLIAGVNSSVKIVGSGSEVLSNVYVAANRNTFDQILLEGNAVSIKADPGQITRLSYIDLTDDIVQVEFSGSGTLTLVLDYATGPELPKNYNQSVKYIRGHARIIVTDSDETTNLGVFSVGRITAVNQALFKSDVAYQGLADIAYVAIHSKNGKFGGLRTANANYFAADGIAGVYAPGVQFIGPVFIGNIGTIEDAQPYLLLGGSSDVRITGGDLYQDSLRPITFDGITRLRFTAGSSSHATADLSAKSNRGRLWTGGIDVTRLVIQGP